MFICHLLQIRIWARKKAIDDKQGDYALNVTGPILQFYERYYNATYPLSKSGRSTLHLLSCDDRNTELISFMSRSAEKHFCASFAHFCWTV